MTQINNQPCQPLSVMDGTDMRKEISCMGDMQGKGGGSGPFMMDDRK